MTITHEHGRHPKAPTMRVVSRRESVPSEPLSERSNAAASRKATLVEQTLRRMDKFREKAKFYRHNPSPKR